jgi:hypothetical protein
MRQEVFSTQDKPEEVFFIGAFGWRSAFGKEISTSLIRCTRYYLLAGLSKQASWRKLLAQQSTRRLTTQRT